MDNEQMLTPEAVAQLLGVSVMCLGQWRHRGHGPAYVKLSHKKVRYRESAVRGWLSANEHLVAMEEPQRW